jgi:hypothetical protein
MSLGIRQIFVLGAAVPLTSDAALGTIGLSTPIAANQTMKLKIWIPITVGATGGFQFQIVVPAAPTAIVSTTKFVNTVAPAIVASVQVTSVAVTNALANAGNHFVEVDAVVVNGVNAGTVDIQVAQATSDVLTLTVLRGATLEATIV